MKSGVQSSRAPPELWCNYDNDDVREEGGGRREGSTR